MSKTPDQITTDVDIAIVGGGAIGSVLALQLNSDGYRVAVIESRKSDFTPSDPERIIALSHGSRCHLEALGVWPQIEAAGAGLIRHIHVSEPGNEGEVDLDAEEARAMAGDLEALGYVLEMGQVLSPLYARMEGMVELIAPAQVTGVTQIDGAMRLSLREGDAGRDITARLVIGADGTHSHMRQLAGISLFGWDYNRYGLVASVQVDKPHRDAAYECFRQAGPLAFLPLADGRFSIVWALEPAEASRMLTMPDALFLRRLEKAAGPEVIAKTGRITGIGRRGIWPLELSIARQYAGERIVLAGNAAHTIHPVAGQGMNLGLRDALVLAEALSSDLAHADPGNPILLTAYAEQRRLDVLAVAGFTESMLGGFAAAFEPARWLRSRSLETMQRMSSLKNLLVRQAAGIGQMHSLKLPPGERPQQRQEERVV